MKLSIDAQTLKLSLSYSLATVYYFSFVLMYHNAQTEKMNEWMNEWMNERTNERTNQSINHNQSINQSINQSVSK